MVVADRNENLEVARKIPVGWKNWHAKSLMWQENANEVKEENIYSGEPVIVYSLGTVLMKRVMKVKYRC